MRSWVGVGVKVGGGEEGVGSVVMRCAISQSVDIALVKEQRTKFVIIPRMALYWMSVIR